MNFKGKAIAIFNLAVWWSGCAMSDGQWTTLACNCVALAATSFSFITHNAIKWTSYRRYKSQAVLCCIFFTILCFSLFIYIFIYLFVLCVVLHLPVFSEHTVILFSPGELMSYSMQHLSWTRSSWKHNWQGVHCKRPNKNGQRITLCL